MTTTTYKLPTVHRYELEPYKGISTRYTCPQCGQKKTLSRYIDNENGGHLSANVGRCTREINCGYHYTPRAYFKDKGIYFKDKGMPVPRTIARRKLSPNELRRQNSIIAPSVCVATLCNYAQNNFVLYLIDRFGVAIAAAVGTKYQIGTSRHWPGATVFWLIDADRYVRTGKIMLYDRATGKRVKQPYSHITWAHSLLNLPDFELKQCMFGEHLLRTALYRNHWGVAGATGPDSTPVAIVESEKTAMIASIYLPQFIWLACGSLSNLTMDKCKVLQGQKVTLFPDLGCYEKWVAKAKELAYIATFNVSHLLEIKATAVERAGGLDLADYLLRYEPGDFEGLYRELAC
jgi:hypothetical protein